MRQERPYAWRGHPVDQPTLVSTAPVVSTGSARRAAERSRVADTLARLPSGVRTLAAALLILTTAELGVIARYGDGQASHTPALALSVFAPLFAAGAAVLLQALGRLTHRAARLLGGTGDRNTCIEVLVLLAALIALPAAGAFLLWDPGSTPVAIVQLVLSATALIVGVRVIAYLENIGQVRATFAALLPVSLFVVVSILLIALHSALLAALPSDWRAR